MLRRLNKKLGLGTDISLTVVLQGLGALLAFAVQPILARVLGESGWDTYTLCMQTYVMIGAAVVDFGIVAVALPRIAVAGGFSSPAFQSSFYLRSITFVIGLSVAIILAVVFGDSDLLVPVLIGMGVVIVSGRFTSFRQIPEMIWRVKGRAWVVGAVATLDTMLMVSAVLLLRNIVDFTATSVITLLLLVNIPGFILIAFPVVRAFKRSSTSSKRYHSRYVKGMAYSAMPIAIMAIASQLFGRIEPLVINAVYGKDLVGDYIAAISPLMGTIFIAVSISVGLQPLLSQVHKRARSDVKGEWVMSVGVNVLGGIAISISAISLLFAEEIIGLFGKVYTENAWMLRIYSITNILEFLVILYDQSLIGIDKRREVMTGTLLSLGLALAFQVVGIIYWGIAGILVAKTFSVAGKIVYQMVVIGKSYRVGAINGMIRLTAVAILFAAGYYFTTDITESIFRAVLLLPLLVIILFASRTINFSDLRKLRRLQLT
ncbi:MAG: polysaccharide biosynthesis C-terminal domain-containing protein [Chlorobi bacterium]|nr:polysaccharide biosynthesis C-terminal domain-containing protein [Chlorobiota bacterium]